MVGAMRPPPCVEPAPAPARRQPERPERRQVRKHGRCRRSLSGAEGDAVSAAPAVHPLWKTRLCSFYAAGECRKGTQCSYAHGEENLRPSPDFERTSVCPVLLNRGQCNKVGCRYAHTSQELRRVDGLLKTKMCAFFERGLCVVGEACRFAHCVEDLAEAARVQGSVVEVTPGSTTFRQLRREAFSKQFFADSGEAVLEDFAGREDPRGAAVACQGQSPPQGGSLEEAVREVGPPVAPRDTTVVKVNFDDDDWADQTDYILEDVIPVQIAAQKMHAAVKLEDIADIVFAPGDVEPCIPDLSPPITPRIFERKRELPEEARAPDAGGGERADVLAIRGAPVAPPAVVLDIEDTSAIADLCKGCFAACPPIARNDDVLIELQQRKRGARRRTSTPAALPKCGRSPDALGAPPGDCPRQRASTSFLCQHRYGREAASCALCPRGRGGGSAAACAACTCGLKVIAHNTFLTVADDEEQPTEGRRRSLSI